MPQKTVFIRDEDIDDWNLIEKKSQFVHEAIINRYPNEPIRPTSISNPTNPSPFRSPGKLLKGGHPPREYRLDTAEKLYNIIVEVNGVIVRTRLTKEKAETELAKLNVDGDMAIVEMK